MGLGNGIWELLSGQKSVIPWPDSFWMLFRYTLIAAIIIGAVLAPLTLWAGAKLPSPKLPKLLAIGALIGPIPFFAIEGASPDAWSALVTFSSLGVLSAFLWWHLVEKHREIEESLNA